MPTSLEGVVFELDPEGKPALEQAEGLGNGYMEKNGEHTFTGVSEIRWSCELSTSEHGSGNAL
jgi:hypothetical protein